MHAADTDMLVTFCHCHKYSQLEQNVSYTHCAPCSECLQTLFKEQMLIHVCMLTYTCMYV